MTTSLIPAAFTGDITPTAKKRKKKKVKIGGSIIRMMSRVIR